MSWKHNKWSTWLKVIYDSGSKVHIYIYIYKESYIYIWQWIQGVYIVTKDTWEKKTPGYIDKLKSQKSTNKRCQYVCHHASINKITWILLKTWWEWCMDPFDSMPSYLLFFKLPMNLIQCSLYLFFVITLIFLTIISSDWDLIGCSLSQSCMDHWFFSRFYLKLDLQLSTTYSNKVSK